MTLTPEIVAAIARADELLVRQHIYDCPALADPKLLLPDGDALDVALQTLIGVMFPGFGGHSAARPDEASAIESLTEVAGILQEQISRAYAYRNCLGRDDKVTDPESEGNAITASLMEELPHLQEVLREDLHAAYNGDPAAASLTEIVLSYPGFEAIITNRVAHALYERNVPLIPRMMAERAHSRTGIDIHPGATIGRGFFIDHGTGVVIGETCVIGRHVKIYQGVTLGARSFPLDENGSPIKGIQRHPRVEDNVTVYAEATILGGETVIGEGSEIGGNVWLTHSVPPRSKVYNVQPSPSVVAGGAKVKADNGG